MKMSAYVDPLYARDWGQKCPNQGPGDKSHILRFHYRPGSLRQIKRVWCWDCDWEVRS